MSVSYLSFPAWRVSDWAGNVSYQCGACYRRSLSAAAVPCETRTMEGVPADARCSGCGEPCGPLNVTIAG
ncbi:MAG TPA: hypothetical protein VKI17_12350 [Gemmataceae bacterium]|nr:hypothetical protein [Gemmataceae bacterium]